MKEILRAITILTTILLPITLLHATVSWAQKTAQPNRIMNQVTESIHIRQNTQEQEEQWRNEKQKLLSQYDQLQQKKIQLTELQQSFEEKVKNTNIRISAKQEQIDNIVQIQAEISPLINNQIKELEQFVASDLPFLTEERHERMQRLEQLRDDPEVPVSEKFRKVMEALLVEAEYGNTIEVYQETITTGDLKMLVDIFRLGRIGLFFQTLDKKECGFYNVSASAWQPLPASYNQTLLTAMEIGAKRRPVEFITLPLGKINL